MSEIGKGWQYFKSFSSVLKMIEFVVLLIALGAVGYFYNEVPSGMPKRDMLTFFLFAVIVAWVLVIMFFLIFLTGLYQKMSIVNWPVTVVIIFSISAIVLVVASALLSDTISYYEDRGYCTWLGNINRKAQCNHLIAGAVCGFIATVLFIADIIMHCGTCTVTTTVEN